MGPLPRHPGVVAHGASCASVQRRWLVVGPSPGSLRAGSGFIQLVVQKVLELGWKQRDASRDMGELSWGVQSGASSPDLACALLHFTPELSFVHVGSASCREDSGEDRTGSEGNELSVPVRNLVPTPSRALPRE